MAFDLAFFSLAQTPTMMRRPEPRVQWPGWVGLGITIGAGATTVGRAAVVVDVEEVVSGRVVVVVLVVVAVAAVAAAAASGVGVPGSPSATAASAGAPSPGGVAMPAGAAAGALCVLVVFSCCVLCVVGRQGQGENGEQQRKQAS